MKRALTFAAVLFFATAAAGDTVTLKVRAIMVDDALNQKPVPRLTLLLTPDSGADAIPAQTDFDGTAEVLVVPGNYRIQTPAGIPFNGSQYTWDIQQQITASMTVALSNDNATRVPIAPVAPEPSPSRPVRVVDELTSLYTSLKNSIFTVWSEMGHGTGFLIDESGLVMTNDHVVAGSQTLSVQFDEQRKVRATLVASDPEKDIAILRFDRMAFPEAVVARVAPISDTEAGVVEGERVFTIGSPLNQRKIVTSGVVSKVEARAIISDVNINPGNSGGPLFNSLGEVVGITTFGESGPSGPGVGGIVRLNQASALIALSREKMKTTEAPSAELLPVDPPGLFPLDAIKKAAAAEKFDARPYSFSDAGYDVTLITPVFRYRTQLQQEMEAVKSKQRRNRKAVQAAPNTIQPMEHLRNWAEYVGEYRPVLLIEARPQLREGFWSAFGRGMAASQGIYAGPANLAFRTDFYRMQLLCGVKEVAPIHPGKNPIILNAETAWVRVKDATYSGFYAYPPDAISPKCGVVTLRLFSEKNPEVPVVHLIEPKAVARVWADFEPYRSSVP